MYEQDSMTIFEEQTNQWAVDVRIVQLVSLGVISGRGDFDMIMM